MNSDVMEHTKGVGLTWGLQNCSSQLMVQLDNDSKLVSEMLALYDWNKESIMP